MSKDRPGLSLQLGLMGLLAILINSPGAIAAEASSSLSSPAVEDSHPVDKLKETSEKTFVNRAAFNPTDAIVPELSKPAIASEPMPDIQSSVAPPETSWSEDQVSFSSTTADPAPSIGSIDSVYAADLIGQGETAPAQATPISATPTTCLTVDPTSEKCWVILSPQPPLNLVVQAETDALDEASEDEPDPWRFEFEPYLFIPFSIQTDIVVGDDAEVNRAFLVDQLTEQLLDLLQGQVTGDRITGDRIQNAVEEALGCSTNCLPDILPDLIGEELQVAISDALRQRIEARVQAVNERFPPGTLPIEVSSDLGLADFLEFDFNQLLWLAGRFELWYGNVGIFTQNALSKIGIFDDRDNLDLDIDIDLFSGQSGFLWRVGTASLQTTEVETDELLYPTLTMDLFGGVSYGDVEQTVDFDPGPEFALEADWFEPMIGTRFALAFSNDFALTARAQTSFINEGDTTENWEVLFGADWRLSENFYLRPAYRIYSIGFVDEGAIGTRSLNLTAQGLWLGFAFIF